MAAIFFYITAAAVFFPIASLITYLIDLYIW